MVLSQSSFSTASCSLTKRGIIIMSQLSLFEGDVSEFHWQPPAKFSHDELDDALKALQAMEEGHQYWIGDALLFAQSKLGEDFAQLIPEGKEETWRVYMWVCENVCPAIRKGLAGYTHARLIAKLSHEDQEGLIKQDIKKITSRDLDKKVKVLKNPDAPEPPKKNAPHLILNTGRRKLLLWINGNEVMIRGFDEYASGLLDTDPDLICMIKDHSPDEINLPRMEIKIGVD